MGLYYLQSRYYDPEMGRFLNADALVSTGQGLLGNNMFAYCKCNPISFFDPTGYAAWGTNTVAIREGGWPEGIYESADELLKIQRLRERWMELLKLKSTDDPSKVLSAKYLALYKGIPVLRITSMDNSGFSGGFFIILGDNVNDEATLKHEYGHCSHFVNANIIVSHLAVKRS